MHCQLAATAQQMEGVPFPSLIFPGKAPKWQAVRDKAAKQLWKPKNLISAILQYVCMQAGMYLCMIKNPRKSMKVIHTFFRWF